MVQVEKVPPSGAARNAGLHTPHFRGSKHQASSAPHGSSSGAVQASSTRGNRARPVLILRPAIDPGDPYDDDPYGYPYWPVRQS